MRRNLVRIITKTETFYAIRAEGPQEAMERVLAGDGEQSGESFPEPHIFVISLES